MLFNTPIQPDNAFCRLNRHRLESTISCYSKPGASSSSPSRGAPAPPPISCPSIATKAHRSQHQERANLSILPPRNQRLEHISALVIPKARTPRQPFYHIPSLNPKPLTIIAMCCIISPANQYLELPPPLHQDDRQKHFRPSPQLPGMVAKAHLPPLMSQWLLYLAFHVARTNENVINWTKMEQKRRTNQ